MRALVVCALAITMLFSGINASRNDVARGAESAIINNMNCAVQDYVIKKNAFFAGEPFVVIKTLDELEAYVQKILDGFKNDTAITPDGYWEALEKQVRESYARYDQEFFKKNILVIALVDQGSGNVSYNLENIQNEDGKLTINVKRDAPMIQTMDFVSWVMFLELSNTCEISSVTVNIVK